MLSYEAELYSLWNIFIIHILFDSLAFKHVAASDWFARNLTSFSLRCEDLKTEVQRWCDPLFKSGILKLVTTMGFRRFLNSLLLLLLSCFSHVRLCATPQTAAHQVPLSLGFSRKEHWSGLPFPSPKHESEVAQSYPTLSNPMDCSPPGPSIHEIFQTRVLEWGAIAFYINSLSCMQKLSSHISDRLSLFFSFYLFAFFLSVWYWFWADLMLLFGHWNVSGQMLMRRERRWFWKKYCLPDERE